jgi:hypothetical protein
MKELFQIDVLIVAVELRRVVQGHDRGNTLNDA